MKIIITGGLGFIGSTFIKKAIKNKNINIFNIDKKTYASFDHNKKLIKSSSYKYYKIDISNYIKLKNIISKIKPDYIINFAAETHVDRSIEDPSVFIKSNIMGTFNILKSIKNLNLIKKTSFIQISTDEVFGSSKSKIPFNENSKYSPNSPYSASKASADHLVRSFYKTYNLKTIIVHPSNNFGPFQYLEKLIPVIVTCCINKKRIPIYGKGKQVRDWLFVEDTADAIYKIMLNGKIGENYNITTRNLLSNIQLVKMICLIYDKITNSNQNSFKLVKFVKDRPGHDFKYNISNKKITHQLGWKFKKNFKQKLKITINWYIQNYKKK